MDLRDILPHLQYFYVVAKEKNFNKAAEIVHLSVTSVRYHVRSLEDKLKVELVNKSNKKDSFLTKEGERIFNECQIVFDYAEETIERIYNKKKNSVFVIAASISFGMRLLIPAISYINKNFNGLYCRVNLTNSIVDLIENNVDIAIRNIPPAEESNITGEKLMYSKTVAIASREYLLNSPPLESIEDIKNHKVIIFREKDRNWEKVKDVYPNLKMPDNVNIVTISDNRGIIEFVRGGGGIGMVPVYELDQYNMQKENLEYVLEDYISSDDFNLMHTLYICYPKFNVRAETIKEFIKYFKVFLKDHKQLVIDAE